MGSWAALSLAFVSIYNSKMGMECIGLDWAWLDRAEEARRSMLEGGSKAKGNMIPTDRSSSASLSLGIMLHAPRKI